MSTATWHTGAEFFENNSPDLWRLCYPRVYKDAGGYHSPKHLAVDLAAILSAVQKTRLPAASASHLIGELAIGATRLTSLRVPIFFVAPGLLTAIQETAPPVEIDGRSTPLPFHSAAFMLPQGALRRESEGDVAFIWYSRWTKGDTGTFPGTVAPRKTFTTGDDALLIRLVSSSAEYQQIYSGRTDPVLNLIDLAGLQRGGSIEGSFALSTEDAMFVSAAVSLVFGILFVMLARPNLVELGQPAAKKTQRGAEFWSPNVIGRSYKIIRQVRRATGESGISPRMHWRRGHWRRQAFGPQQSLRRDQWIEPMLVAAERHNDPTQKDAE